MSLGEKIKALQDQVTTLESDVDTIKAENEQLKTAAEEAASKQDELQAKNDELTAAAETYETEKAEALQAVTEERDGALAKVTDLEAAAEAAKAEFEAQAAELAEAKKQLQHPALKDVGARGEKEPASTSASDGNGEGAPTSCEAVLSEWTAAKKDMSKKEYAAWWRENKTRVMDADREYQAQKAAEQDQS